ncbi:MAG: hypothetical protein ABJB47_02450 [Actinomycetota bacterium]
MRARLTALAGAISMVAFASGVGLASASTRSAGPQIEHFQLVTTSASAVTIPVVAYGLFTGRAVAVAGERAITYRFADGSFQVFTSSGTGPSSFDTRTCLGFISQHGTYRLSHGTGKFAGISGHGKFQADVRYIARRNARGTCSRHSVPTVFQEIFKASGPAQLRAPRR